MRTICLAAVLSFTAATAHAGWLDKTPDASGVAEDPAAKTETIAPEAAEPATPDSDEPERAKPETKPDTETVTPVTPEPVTPEPVTPEPAVKAADLAGIWNCQASEIADPTLTGMGMLVSYKPDGTSEAALTMMGNDGGTPFSIKGEGTGTWALEGDKLTEAMTAFKFTQLQVGDQVLPWAQVPMETRLVLESGMNSSIGQPSTSTVLTLDDKTLSVKDDEAGAVLTCSRL